MIPPLFSHKRYVRSALAYSRRHGGLRTDHRHYHVWQKLNETNLDHAYPLLATLYSDILGCLGRDPVSMLRSCLATMLCGITSFTNWVGMMHDDPFHALISVHCLATIYRAYESFGLCLQPASLDAAHDALGLFRLASQRWHMALVVPLNERNRDNLRHVGPLRLEKGIPICQAGLSMKR
jgi:hypothetical protein